MPKVHLTSRFVDSLQPGPTQDDYGRRTLALTVFPLAPRLGNPNEATAYIQK